MLYFSQLTTLCCRRNGQQCSLCLWLRQTKNNDNTDPSFSYSSPSSSFRFSGLSGSQHLKYNLIRFNSTHFNDIKVLWGFAIFFTCSTFSSCPQQSRLPVLYSPVQCVQIKHQPPRLKNGANAEVPQNAVPLLATGVCLSTRCLYWGVWSNII